MELVLTIWVVSLVGAGALGALAVASAVFSTRGRCFLPGGRK